MKYENLDDLASSFKSGALDKSKYQLSFNANVKFLNADDADDSDIKLIFSPGDVNAPAKTS